MGLYPEGKDPDSPPGFSLSFALQAASSPLSPPADNPRTRSFPPSLCALFFAVFFSPAPESALRLKQSATQSQFLFCFFSFFLYVRRVGSKAPLFLSFFLSFTPGLCSQATTQLKWFAAAKKISLFSSHSRSLACCSPLLSRSLTHSHVPSVSLSLPASLAVCV